MRQFAFDIFTRADKVLRVVVVLFNAGCDREDVRVEDDIFWREANLFGEDFVRPTANLDFPCAGIGLVPVRQRPLPPLPHRNDARASRDG